MTDAISVALALLSAVSIGSAVAIVVLVFVAFFKTLYGNRW